MVVFRMTGELPAVFQTIIPETAGGVRNVWGAANDLFGLRRPSGSGPDIRDGSVAAGIIGPAGRASAGVRSPLRKHGAGH